MVSDVEFSRLFKMTGKSSLDGWRIVLSDMEGDCNDHSLTIAYLLADQSPLKMLFNFVTLRTVIWWVWSPVNGAIPKHTALYHRGTGWIDTHNREWGEKHRNKRLFLPLTALPLLWWPLLRIVQGGVHRVIKG